MDESEVINFGNSIRLSGFKALDGGSMLILKKMIGNYVRKLSDSKNFEKLNLNLNSIVENDSKKFEISAELVNGGKTYNSKVIDNNVFVAIGDVMKKLDNSLLQ